MSALSYIKGKFQASVPLKSTNIQNPHRPYRQFNNSKKPQLTNYNVYRDALDSGFYYPTGHRICRIVENIRYSGTVIRPETGYFCVEDSVLFFRFNSLQKLGVVTVLSPFLKFNVLKNKLAYYRHRVRQRESTKTSILATILFVKIVWVPEEKLLDRTTYAKIKKMGSRTID